MSEHEKQVDYNSVVQQINSSDEWKQLDMGSTRRIDHNERFWLFKRTRKISEVLGHFSQSKTAITADILNLSANPRDCGPKSQNISRRKGPSSPEIADVFQTISEVDLLGTNPAMGKPEVSFVPDPIQDDNFVDLKLSWFDDFESLRALRSNEDSLVIGFDSEWFGDNERKMLSWQFALIHDDYLFEYVFIKRDFANAPACDNLWIELALARILDDLDSPAYKCINCKDAILYKFIYDLDPKTNAALEATTDCYDTALTKGQYAYVYGKPTEIPISEIKADISQFNFSKADCSYFKRVVNKEIAPNISITLVSHAAKADITTLYQQCSHRKDLLRFLKEAGGGIFTTQPIYLEPKSVATRNGWNYFYPIELHIRDSLCSAPSKERSLSALGEVVGIPKVDLPTDNKEHMDSVLVENPTLYLDYASTDAVIAMLYTSSIYGINKSQSVTILSAGTEVIRASMSDYLGTANTVEFNKIYRGLQRKSHGKKANPNGPGFIASKDLEPQNNDAESLMVIASKAFHGGYNSCSDVGFYDIETYDYDLMNAYPTAMCLVSDQDWDNCIAYHFERGHVLTEQDFLNAEGIANPFLMMFALVHYEFPHGIKYPCLLNEEDGVPVFTRTSDGLDGTFACGPELYLAVKLGAKVTVLEGYIVQPRYRCDGSTSYSLRHAIKGLVTDRRSAKELCGKGSIEELILKLIVNGSFGKNAQNVKVKSRWSAYTGEMENIGCSIITNPVSAAMITSIVRAVLLAAQNQITDMGYAVYSVTTDGFISNIPEEILKTLDLHGLRDALAEARLYLTDGADPEIWEIKHTQSDLLNLTTRGNVSLNTGEMPKHLPHYLTPETAADYYKNPVYMLPGVCAHNGTKSGYPSDSYDDRFWLIAQSLSRTGAVEYKDTEWTSFKELVNGTPFRVKNVLKKVRMDFDMKRKPIQHSLSTVYPEINGVQYEIANFTTEPFESIEEFLKYRRVKEKVVCLRTVNDWNIYFNKLSYHGTSAKPRDFEFSKLMSVIKLSRTGLLSISYLDDPKLTVDDKLKLINYINSSGKPFKKDDWKRARRPERQSSILPIEELTDLIEKMKSISHLVSEILHDKSACCNLDAFRPFIVWLKRLLFGK